MGECSEFDIVISPCVGSFGPGYHAALSTRMARRTNDALSRIVDAQKRTLPAEDHEALGLLRDTLSNCIASGKAREGVLDGN